MTSEFDKTLNPDPLLHMAKGKQVSEELPLRNDTHLRISWTEALAIYEDLGFEEIFSEEFEDKGFYPDEPSKTEVFKVFWRNGFLLTAESYNKQATLNSSKIYYNWIPKAEIKAHHYTSSGGYDKNSDGVLVWYGNHDTREGLRNIISDLESNGEILDQWQFVPFLWLLNFSVKRNEGYSYEAENVRVISQIPVNVQEKILVGKRS